jgi:pyruvate/2-oxoglutarate dehydrogenase complex dihydrolipoamide dehydrogenase (E3) component
VNHLNLFGDSYRAQAQATIERLLHSIPAAMSESKPKVAVMGAGAVGCYYGGMLARAGVPVTLVGRAHHADAIARPRPHHRAPGP